MAECGLGCGLPVDKNDPRTWKEVQGWVGGPRKDSMRLRHDTGRYAHPACVAKLQEGQTIDQPGIFDEEERVNTQFDKNMAEAMGVELPEDMR